MIQELFKGFVTVFVYFVLCASCALLLRRLIRPPRELFRKTLHLIALFSVLVWVNAFETWWIASLASLLFAALIYPILALAERFKGYSKLLTERSKGEIKNSLILVFGMFAVVIAVCWGWRGDKMLVLAAVFAWGLGDAAAALVGKRFGRNFLEGKLIEGRKSVEGTHAMFAVSFVAVFVVLLFRGGLPWYGYIATAVFTAVVCALVELYTLNGYDTVSCPFAATAILVPMVGVWGA